MLCLCGRRLKGSEMSGGDVMEESWLKVVNKEKKKNKKKRTMMKSY